jgi:hypothetical protein
MLTITAIATVTTNRPFAMRCGCWEQMNAALGWCRLEDSRRPLLDCD